MGKPVGMQTMRGVEWPEPDVNECHVCGQCFPVLYGDDLLFAHLRLVHSPYREPWWLRLLRWVVR